MANTIKAGALDLILPAAVVSVVGMMIFPLPTAVLDLLLMLNIAFALALLVSSVYLSEPEKFTSLPTILLLSTIFRLGLNISTTRQLLGRGEAPEIVVAFGNFVVSGNLVVGVVVFSIVTLVQFLVIAKGAERVAEVAARFTLDAMPGKQMSIDADIRSGILSLNEAREKRLELHRESKLYGALDGAMKFVKGDAIAGLIITVVNITAGLFVGVYQQGLAFGAAAHKYTIFTIGDGLVSQIPALLVAVAAGLAVTRVGDKSGSFIGRDMFSQLGKEPQALATTGAVLCMLGLVPGLPTVPFILFGAGIWTYARRRMTVQAGRDRQQKVGEFKPKVFSAIVLYISPRAILQLQRERSLPGYVQALRNEIFERWGVVVPDVQFDVDGSQERTSLWIALNGVRMRYLEAPAEIANAAKATTEKPTAKAVASKEDVFSRQILAALRGFIVEHLHELIDDTHTRMLTETHSPVAEDLINNLIPNVISVTALTALLRELVSEGVSIRQLRVILQAIADYHLQTQEGVLSGPVVGTRGSGMSSSRLLRKASGTEGKTDLRELLCEVRIALSRLISRAAADGDWSVRSYVVGPELSHLLAEINLADVPLEPNLIVGIQTEAKRLREATKERKGRMILLTTKYARPVLSNILKSERPGLLVIAAEELSEEVRMEIVGDFMAEALVSLKPAQEPQENFHQPISKVLPFERRAA